jgi:hypothetical protein
LKGWKCIEIDGMVNYGNGKIYKLVSFQNDDVYYGSTTGPLTKRLSGHRRAYNYRMGGKGCYMTSFEIVKHPDVYIVLVESINCKSKEELFAVERKYIENNDCVNKTIPGRTKKQYYQDKKETISAKKKQHYQDNRERIAIISAQYRKENRESINKRQNEKILCECGNYYTRTNISHHNRSKKHLKYLLSIADTDTEYSSESSEYIYDGVTHAKIVSL